MYTIKASQRNLTKSEYNTYFCRSVGCFAICHCSASWVPTSLFVLSFSLTCLPAVVSIAGIICERLGVLCQSAGFNFHFAEVYLAIIDFISIRFVLGLFTPPLCFECCWDLCSVALYGLIIFYGLTKNELKGRRPLAKFLCIKFIVMITFYQSFLVNFLVLVTITLLSEAAIFPAVSLACWSAESSNLLNIGHAPTSPTGWTH